MPGAAPDAVNLCGDLAAVLSPEPVIDELHMVDVENTVELMMARLDELSGMLEALNFQTIQQRTDLEPQLTQLAQMLVGDYEKIDKTAEAMNVMRQAVSRMEEELANAETAFRARNIVLRKHDDVEAIKWMYKSGMSAVGSLWGRAATAPKEAQPAMAGLGKGVATKAPSSDEPARGTATAAEVADTSAAPSILGAAPASEEPSMLSWLGLGV